MELRPGWMILLKAAQAMLHYDPKTQDRESTLEVYQWFTNQVICRMEESIPPEHEPEVIDAVVQATLRCSTVMPVPTYLFLVNRGGDRLIDQFLEEHPGWVRGICPCGCQDLTVLHPALYAEMGFDFLPLGQRGGITLLIPLRRSSRPNRRGGRRDNRGHQSEGMDRR